VDKCWVKFRKYASAGQPVSLSDWASYFTFDVVGALAVGAELDFVEKRGRCDNIIFPLHHGRVFLIAAIKPCEGTVNQPLFKDSTDG
jgi:hypothetical protein